MSKNLSSTGGLLQPPNFEGLKRDQVGISLDRLIALTQEIPLVERRVAADGHVYGCSHLARQLYEDIRVLFMKPQSAEARKLRRRTEDLGADNLFDGQAFMRLGKMEKRLKEFDQEATHISEIEKTSHVVRQALRVIYIPNSLQTLEKRIASNQQPKGGQVFYPRHLWSAECLNNALKDCTELVEPNVFQELEERIAKAAKYIQAHRKERDPDIHSVDDFDRPTREPGFTYEDYVARQKARASNGSLVIS